jgi:hypothetical protein
MTKFCLVLEQNNKKKEKETRRKQVEVEVLVKKQKTTTSTSSSKGFAGFESDTEDEVEEVKVSAPVTMKKKVSKDEFPVLTTVKPVVVELTGWASIAAKPKLERQVAATYIDSNVVIQEPTKCFTITVSDAPKLSPAPWAKAKDTSESKNKKWADYSDSESEDETW